MSTGHDTPQHPPGDTAGTRVTRREFLVLFSALFLPMFLAAVDQTLLATATPAIAASLGGLRDTSWIVVGYLIAAATIVPVYGRLGDSRGRRNMLLVALAVFAAGSAACALAQSLPQLVAARILQGLGGGGMMMLSHALIGEMVPPIDRVRFQGYLVIVFTTASVSGPVIGGLVVTAVSWRWLFLANLPLAAFAAWRLSRLPRGDRHPPQGGDPDVAGHVLFALSAMTGLFWLTSVGHRFSWGSTESLALGGAAAISFVALTLNERHRRTPFLPVDLLRDKVIRLSVVLVMFFAACMFAVIFLLPIYLQLGHRVSPALSGLLLLPVTAGQVTAAMIASRVLRRTGNPYPIPIVGMSVSSAGLLLLGLLPSHFALTAVLGVVTGLGLGTVMPVSQLLVQVRAGRPRLGAVSALSALFRNTGGAAGTALIGTLVFTMIPGADRHSLAAGAGGFDTASVIRAFHWTFVVTAVVAALAACIASRIPRVRLWEAKRGPE
ncbi:MAG: MFS transporter [Burkholderiales bacterium]|nr:MFS transporter [Burkholderiales bacterium]